MHSINVTIHMNIHVFAPLKDSGPPLESYLTGDSQLMDVRTEVEFESNAAKGAINVPLASLNSLKDTLNK